MWNDIVLLWETKRKRQRNKHQQWKHSLNLGVGWTSECCWRNEHCGIIMIVLVQDLGDKEENKKKQTRTKEELTESWHRRWLWFPGSSGTGLAFWSTEEPPLLLSLHKNAAHHYECTHCNFNFSLNWPCFLKYWSISSAPFLAEQHSHGWHLHVTVFRIPPPLEQPHSVFIFSSFQG